jgi:phosphoribosyl 1,2-cyclic phosphodiesterase
LPSSGKNETGGAAFKDAGVLMMISFIPYASGSTGNLYTVTNGRTTIMLDCGISWKKAREHLTFTTSSSIDGVLLSHSHKDHCKGARDAAKAGLDIFASKKTFETLQIPEHRKNIIEAGRIFSIGAWHIFPFSTAHDTDGSLGFYMVNFEGEGFLYLTDSAYSQIKFKRLDVISVECNFMPDILNDNVQSGLPAVVGHRIRRTHMSLDTVINFLKANDLSKCREIHLLHLSDGNSDEAQMIKAVQEATGIPTYACKN